MDKIIGVVILYQPDMTVLPGNIQTYLAGLDKLLVYDNTETSSSARSFFDNTGDGKIEYVFFGENEGISKRLNMAAEYGIRHGFSHLLMMDQDSSFPEGSFKRYLEKIGGNRIGRVAQYGINCQPELTPVESEPRTVISLITSGSVLDLAYFHAVGPFDENLFIDFVDLAFSYRVVAKGYLNLMFTDIILNHRIGFIKMGRSLKNFRLTPRLLHSPVRVYYIVRNGLYLLFRANYLNADAKADVKRSMRIIKNDILYSDQRGAVFSSLFRGVFDFIRNKMGKK